MKNNGSSTVIVTVLVVEGKGENRGRLNETYVGGGEWEDVTGLSHAPASVQSNMSCFQ